MLGWDAKNGALIAPAVARNKGVILEVLHRVLPTSGTVLEIASGSGEHAVHFAREMPALVWQPSDPAEEARSSIAAHAQHAGLPNLLPPVVLDAASQVWPVENACAVLAINMVHIAPWTAAEGLMAGAARVLPTAAPLYLYGPFKESGRHTAESNEAFDADLRRRNPEWGVRDLEDVCAAAARHGFRLDEKIAMPANNLSVVFRR